MKKVAYERCKYKYYFIIYKDRQEYKSQGDCPFRAG